MRKTALVLAALLASQVLPAQVPHYDADLSVDPDRGTIEGTIRVTLPAGSHAASTASFRLLLNTGAMPNPEVFPFFETGRGPEGFSPSGAEIADLTVDGQPASVTYVKAPAWSTTYGLERMYARADLGQVSPQAETVIQFTYRAVLPHRKLTDDFHFDDTMLSRFSWFPSLTREDDLGRLVLEPFTYRAAIAVRSGWEMARVGTSFRREGNRIELESGTPVVSLPLVFLRGFVRYTVPWLADTKTLDIWYRPEAEDVARLVSAYAREALDYYAARYFPYEAAHVSVVQGAQGGYGMAADSLVVLGDAFFAGLNRGLPGLQARSLEFVVDHEIGHLYWGVGAPIDFLSDNYLSEGLNEYSTLEWYESKYGRWDNLFPPQNDLIARLVVDLTGQLVGPSYASQKYLGVRRIHQLGWDNPLSAPPGEKIANAQASTDYEKSWFVLSMLGRYVGRETFRQALGQLAVAYRYRPFGTREFAAFLERTTGKELDAFFHAFVYGTQSVDYELRGNLNEPFPGGLRSRLEVRDLQGSGVFVPATITVFLEDGATHEISVDAPGVYVVETPIRVTYAGVDKDAENLDYNRKNNFWPRRLMGGRGSEHWLLDGATDKIYLSSLPYVGNDPVTGAIDLGVGLTVTDTSNYTVTLDYFGSVPADPTQLAGYGFGGALTAALTPNPGLSLGLDAVYRYPATVSSAGLGLAKTFYVPLRLGNAGRTFHPILGLSLWAGARGLDLLAPAGGYLDADADLGLDLTVKTGTLVSLGNAFRWHWGSGAVENQASLDVAQAIPFLANTLLGVQLRASAAFGTLVSFRGSNAVLGADRTGEAVYAYDAGARAFLGIPLFNHVEWWLANLLVVQSLNLAFVYEVGTAFNTAADLLPMLQQAVGVELLPALRTVGDLTLGLALGVGLNLTAIAASPTTPESYLPIVYVDLSVLPTLFNSVVPY